MQIGNFYIHVLGRIEDHYQSPRELNESEAEIKDINLSTIN